MSKIEELLKNEEVVWKSLGKLEKSIWNNW